MDNNGQIPEFDIGAYEATIQSQTQLLVAPHKINTSGDKRSILAIMTIPEATYPSELSERPLWLYPGGIESTQLSVLGSQGRENIFARFNRADFLNAVSGIGAVEAQVFGLLKSGSYLYGKEIIEIIGPQDR